MGSRGRAGAEPAITTTETSSPDEFADLVEYCYGNATTKMGALRIADKHPDPYKLRFIELGKRDQYEDTRVSLGHFLDAAMYSGEW